MEDETQYRFRISILKSYGSVWMEECEDMESVIEQVISLLDKHPHLLVSKQKVVDKNGR